MSTVEEALRRLTFGDTALIAALWAPVEDAPDGGLPRLDDRTEALLRIGALVALDAPVSSYLAPVAAAQRAGSTVEDILAVLVAVAGAVGSARVISAAPRVAMAAGYDVDAALERADASDHDRPAPLPDQ